jgi:hypothetical protein
MSIASEEDKRWIIRRKRMYEGIKGRDAKAGAQKVKRFDNAASRFIADNPKCTVINLACGFDTRFWRLDLDMVPEKYTQGIWKSLIRLHSRIDFGLDVSWDFGINDPHDLEAYGNGL